MSAHPPAREVVLIDRGDLQDNSIAATATNDPDLRVKLVQPLVAALIRAFRTFLQVFLAAFIGVTVGPGVPLVSDVMPPAEFGERAAAALYVAAVSALVTFIWNLIEILAKLDETAPVWRA